MWSNGVGIHTVYILMTGVVSFTFVNVYEIKDKKIGFKNYVKIAVLTPLPY